MSFHNVRLPIEVEQGSQGGPEFLTTVITMANGAEQRQVDWSKDKGGWDVSYGIQERADFEDVLAHFRARRGRAYSFPFRDWGDYQLNDELIGLGDGADVTFQLIKTYEPSGPLPYVRPILCPEAGMIITVNSIVVVPTSISTTTGIVTLAVAPAAAQEVRATGIFNAKARYDTDRFTLIWQTFAASSIGQLPIRELRE